MSGIPSARRPFDSNVGSAGVWVVWVIQLIFSKNTNLWSKKVGLGEGSELFL